MRFLSSALTLFALVVSSAQADSTTQYRVWLDKAVERFTSTPNDSFAFHLYSFENEEGNVREESMTFDPTRSEGKQWKLQQVSGVAPTIKQLRKFDERFNQNTERKSIPLNLKTLVSSPDLNVVAETDNYVQISFPVNHELLGKDSLEKLTGELVFDKKNYFISIIRIRNTSPFSPMMLAEIDQFVLELKFVEFDEHVLVDHAKMNMKGTYAYFVEIEEISHDVYSQYRYTGK